jgi:hypothetical protein
MSRAFLGVDHAVIATRDLEKAAETWERLGFQLTPRSQDPAFGSHSRCIILGGDYIELMESADQATPLLSTEFLKHREGLAALALRMPDAAAARALLRKEGFKLSEPADISRQLILPDGSEATARLTVAMIDPEQTLGAQCFGCLHHTPEYFWASDYRRHPNRADRISAIIFGAPVATKAARIFERLCASIGRGGPNKSIEVPTGDVPIFVLPDDYLSKTYPNIGTGVPTPGFVGLSIQTFNLQETANLLTANGVPFHGSPALHLLIAPEHANGLLVEFFPSQKNYETQAMTAQPY